MCFGFGLIAKSSIGNLFEILHALHYSAKFMNLVQIYSLQRKLNIFFAEICLSNTISKENFMVCICLKGMLWLQHSVNKASRAVNAMKHWSGSVANMHTWTCRCKIWNRDLDVFGQQSYDFLSMIKFLFEIASFLNIKLSKNGKTIAYWLNL